MNFFISHIHVYIKKLCEVCKYIYISLYYPCSCHHDDTDQRKKEREKRERRTGKKPEGSTGGDTEITGHSG